MLKHFPWAGPLYLNPPDKLPPMLARRRTQQAPPRESKTMQPELFGKPKPITLVVKGSVPGFKNSKMLIAKGPNGRPLDRPLMITKPEIQKRMTDITESFVLQLLSAWQTDDGRTLTGCSLRSLIALCVPDDDCWTRIPKMSLEAIIDPENEGATITIQRV